MVHEGEADDARRDLGNDVLLVVQVLLHMLAVALESVELVVLSRVKDDHGEDNQEKGLDHSIELDDTLGRFSARDLLLKDDKLCRLSVGA